MHCKACDAPITGDIYKTFKDPVTEVEYPFEEDLCNQCLAHVRVEEHIVTAMIDEGYWRDEQVPAAL